MRCSITVPSARKATWPCTARPSPVTSAISTTPSPILDTLDDSRSVTRGVPCRPSAGGVGGAGRLVGRLGRHEIAQRLHRIDRLARVLEAGNHALRAGRRQGVWILGLAGLANRPEPGVAQRPRRVQRHQQPRPEQHRPDEDHAALRARALDDPVAGDPQQPGEAADDQAEDQDIAAPRHDRDEDARAPSPAGPGSRPSAAPSGGPPADRRPGEGLRSAGVWASLGPVMRRTIIMRFARPRCVPVRETSRSPCPSHPNTSTPSSTRTSRTPRRCSSSRCWRSTAPTW